MVDGLRDVLLSWCDDHSDEVTSFVRGLLHDQDEIVRRIGIYVLNRRWASLRDLYLPVVSSEFFQSGHLHELYGLLSKRFDDMSDAEKDATLAAIRSLPEPTWSDDPARSLRRRQRRWLSAVVGMGYAAADRWNQELATEPIIGIPEHPDFDVYMETTHGPGPTPYDVHELLTFAREGVLVDKLNAFVPADIWRGPTMEGLDAALEEAVRSEPEFFLEILHQFLRPGGPSSMQSSSASNKRGTHQTSIRLSHGIVTGTRFWASSSESLGARHFGPKRSMRLRSIRTATGSFHRSRNSSRLWYRARGIRTTAF